MKITIINGNEKKGVTFKLKEIFLKCFRENCEIIEFYLPKDCPTFCHGCTNCFKKGENNCPNNAYLTPIRNAILNADLLIFSSPTYVLHTTGAMKSFLDQMAFLFMPHRPHPAMFKKRAVIITQCLGLGAKSAARDIQDSLSWWGISKINVFKTNLVKDISWENLTEHKQKKITKKIERLAYKYARIHYGKPAHTNLKVKLRFYMCRIIQKFILKKQESLDSNYWLNQGWLGKKRPWKR